MPVDKFGHTDGTTVERIVSGGVTLSQVSGTFLRRDGGNAATGNLNMNENSIVELRDPVSSQDAATKNYVDSQIVAYVDVTKNYVNSYATTKNYVDEQVVATKNYVDVTTKNYVDEQVENYVNATMLGPTISVSNTTTQHIIMEEFEKVLFSTIVFDTDSKFDIALSRFSPGKAGYYTVSVNIEFQSLTGYGNVRLFKNGVAYAPICGGGGTSTSYNKATGNILIKLESADYLEIFVYSSVTTNIFAGHFSVAYLRP